MNKRVLLGCLSLVVLTSLILYNILPPDAYAKQSDSRCFLLLATNIKTAGLTHITKLPPVALGYPAVLSLFPTKTIAHYVIVLNILLALLAIGTLYLTTQLLAGTQSASLISIVCLLHVGIITYTQCCLTEIMLFFLYSLFMYAITLFFIKKNRFYALYAGLILGISLWIKPAAWFFGLACIAGGIILTIQGHIKRNAIVYFAVSFLLCALSYMFLNFFYFGWFGLSPVMYINLYSFLLPKIMCVINPTYSFNTAHSFIQSLSPTEKMPFLLKTIISHPVETISVWGMNMIKTTGGLYGSNLAVLADITRTQASSFFKPSPDMYTRLTSYLWNAQIPIIFNLITCFEVFYNTVRSIVFLPGCWLLYKKSKSISLLLFYLIFIAYFIFITGPDGCARLRMMAEPALTIMYVLGLSYCAPSARVS